MSSSRIIYCRVYEKGGIGETRTSTFPRFPQFEFRNSNCLSLLSLLLDHDTARGLFLLCVFLARVECFVEPLVRLGCELSLLLLVFAQTGLFPEEKILVCHRV